MESTPKKLLDQVRDTLRLKHYSTENAYVDWIRRFILFHGKRHPNEMGHPKSKPSSPIWRSKRMSPPPPKIKPSVPFCSSTARC